MKRFKKAICLTAAALLALSLSACTAQKKRSAPQPVPEDLSVPEQQQRQLKQGDIFVSPAGDDGNNGAEALPVRTVERAVSLARQLKKPEKVISFSAGEYPVSALELTSEDSGITFYAEKEAIFNGGVSLDPGDFAPFQDEIKMLDLKKYGVTAEAIGNVKAFGQYNTAEKYGQSGSLYCELFSGGQRMTLARYPNDGENLKTGKIIDNGDSREVYTKQGAQTNEEWDAMENPRGGTFGAEKEVASRIASWKNSPDIWMFGYFQYDWADSTTPLKTYGDDSITTEYASVYGFKERTPYYFFNVLEELDAENEWYIDKENLLLYFIPPAGYAQKPMQLSLETRDLFTLNGAENITFDGITLTGTRANALKGTGNSITIRNCTITNVGESAIDLKGSRIKVENNTITATGKAGVVLEGGDRATLESSENVVTNNLIYNWSQVYQTYQAAVALHGVGGVCSHNEIYQSPHEAITYTGNNHVIEYNVIHDVVLKSSDAGAIYAGRSWSAYGNIVRYNCIYNLGSGEFTPSGIYFDDALSGQKAYGNLLVNIPGCGFLIGGGRDMEIAGNVVVNAATPFHYDDRAIAGIADGGWFTHAKTPEQSLWATLKEVDIYSEQWKTAYPALSNVTSDFNNTQEASFAANPAGSKVQYNVVVNQKKKLGSIEKRVEQYSRVAENYLYKFSENPFAADGGYGTALPLNGFSPLPTGKMGRLYVIV